MFIILVLLQARPKGTPILGEAPSTGDLTFVWEDPPYFGGFLVFSTMLCQVLAYPSSSAIRHC